jgi:hypothetical protein
MLLDEDSQAKYLVNLLKAAGYALESQFIILNQWNY